MSQNCRMIVAKGAALAPNREDAMTMVNVRSVLPGRRLVEVSPEETVRTACARLQREEESAAAVIEDGRLVGILCDRDVIRRSVGAGRRSDETPVREVMTPDPVTVDLDAGAAEALRLMQERGVHHL